MFKRRKEYVKAEVDNTYSYGKHPSADAEGPPQDGELIAVLTAAVAAVMNTSVYALNIKSYKRVNNDFPIWYKAGRNDVINSRF